MGKLLGCLVGRINKREGGLVICRLGKKVDKRNKLIIKEV